MVVVGWFALALGAALFLGSLGMTLRANPRSVVPYNRNAEVVPRYTILTRSAGAALFVIAAVLLGSVTGYWVVLIPAAIVLSGLAAIVRHNRRVKTETASDLDRVTVG